MAPVTNLSVSLGSYTCLVPLLAHPDVLDDAVLRTVQILGGIFARDDSWRENGVCESERNFARQLDSTARLPCSA